MKNTKEKVKLDEVSLTVANNEFIEDLELETVKKIKIRKYELSNKAIDFIILMALFYYVNIL